MERKASRQRVAILGGGCGALSAAFWLSSTPELRARYEVTVYTQGWRLGGKGASGRVMDPAQGYRILEHGLHMMMGFYDNAFTIIRNCYGAMRMPSQPSFPTWEKAFTQQDQITVWMAPGTAGLAQWLPWNFSFPPRGGEPGDRALTLALDARTRFAGVALGLHRLLTEVLDPLKPFIGSRGNGNSTYNILVNELEHQMAANGDPYEPATATAMLALLTPLLALLPDAESEVQVESNTPPPPQLSWYQLLLLARLGLAGLIGFFKDVVLDGPDAMAKLDLVDFKDWLRSHGAGSAAESCLVMSLYDLAFAYPGGDSGQASNGQGATGSCLAMILRMAFAYQCAPLWKMNAGMGDVIFTPLYRLLDRDHGALKSAGVRFEFFHRVKQLGLGADGRIDRIDFNVQARPKAHAYLPLFDVKRDDGTRWDCWPAEPLWDRLEDGQKLHAECIAADKDFEDPAYTKYVGARTLELGRDFDHVVLAIPPAAAEPLTRALAGNAGWKTMLDQTQSVATQSVQLWLKPDLAGLGWSHGATVGTQYVDQLRSWADMSQVLASEPWPQPAPLSCEYLCGTYRMTEGIQPLPSEQEYAAGQWLDRNIAPLWPDALDHTRAGLDPLLVVERYSRLNAIPSERYVLSVPGTISARLAPGASGFANLYLAGDWTLTSLNGGSAEAACESGLRAACALAGLATPPVPQWTTR